MERPVLPSTKTPWFRYPEDLDPVLRDIRDNLDVLDSDVDDIQTGATPSDKRLAFTAPLSLALMPVAGPVAVSSPNGIVRSNY